MNAVQTYCLSTNKAFKWTTNDVSNSVIGNLDNWAAFYFMAP